MRLAVVLSIVLGVIHIGLSGIIILLTEIDVDYSMFFLAIDFPLVVLADAGLASGLFEALTVPGDLGITPFLVLGTVMYAMAGAGIGALVSNIRRRIRRSRRGSSRMRSVKSSK